MAMFNVQRVTTPKLGKSEFRFMCPAHCLTVLNIDFKFRENIPNGIKIMDRTRNYEALTDERTDVLTDGHLLGTQCYISVDKNATLPKSSKTTQQDPSFLYPATQ